MPQAQDDEGSGGEDLGGYLSTADLLLNDLGGSAKTFYGIDQTDPSVAASTSEPTAATTALGATITYDPGTGEIYYDPTLVAQIQALSAGETIADSFTYTIRLQNGALSTATVTYTVTGVNDAAVIGLPADADVAEDEAAGILTANGTLSISDVDEGEASFKTTVILAAGTLGNLVLATDGSYAYTVDNALVQYLGAGDTRIETFTVEALDGTTREIGFTVTGVNDAAVIGLPIDDAVTEDESVGSLSATGTLSISDVDQGEASFVAGVLTDPDNLGSLTLAADGTYTYSVDNSAVQYLGVGQTRTETFTVNALDGTTRTVSFTVTGTSDITTLPLRGVWDFNNGLDDGSPYDNDLTLHGGASIGTGLIGEGLVLNGQQGSGATTQGNYALGSDDFTIQVWVDYNSVGREQTLIEEFTGGNGPGWTLTTFPTEGELGVQFYCPSSQGLLYFHTVIPMDPLEGWNQIVITREGNTFSLYSNGTLVSQIGHSGSLSESSNPLLIGGRNAQDGRNFTVDGTIDNVAIVDGAWSAVDVAAAWNNGEGQIIPGQEPYVGITFDTINNADTYQEDGFIFNTTGNHTDGTVVLEFHDGLENGDPGDTDVIITRADGEAFTLVELDILMNTGGLMIVTNTGETISFAPGATGADIAVNLEDVTSITLQTTGNVGVTMDNFEFLV